MIIKILALLLFGFIIFGIINSGVVFWQEQTKKDKEGLLGFIAIVVFIAILLMVFG